MPTSPGLFDLARSNQLVHAARCFDGGIRSSDTCPVFKIQDDLLYIRVARNAAREVHQVAAKRPSAFRSLDAEMHKRASGVIRPSATVWRDTTSPD